MSDTTYLVSGMTCGHCVAAVTEELSKLPGVSAVTVDLKPDGVSAVHVISDQRPDPAAVREAVDEAGYQLADA